MPATSLSGDCFWRRSASGRAGSPSKSSRTKSPGPVPSCRLRSTRTKRLSKMIVAVNADTLPDAFSICNRTGAAQQFDAPRKNQRRIVCDRAVQSCDLQLECLQRGRQSAPQSGVHLAPDPLAVKGSAANAGSSVGTGQRQMHLAGALAKQRRCLKRQTRVFLDFAGELAFFAKSRRRQSRRKQAARLPAAKNSASCPRNHCHPSPSLITNPCSIAAVVLLPPGCVTADLAQKLRNMREVRHLGQEAPNLHVGILSRLKPPEEFQIS